MSAPYIIPFNYMPTTVGNVLNTGYTVPSGKYSRVTVCLSATAYASSGTMSSDGGEAFSVSNSSETLVATFWMMAAEALTVSRSAASAGPSAAAQLISSTSDVSVSIGGVVVAQISAPCTAVLVTTDDSITISGGANVSVRYEEYSVIS